MVENTRHNDKDKFQELTSRSDRISIENLEIDMARK